METIQINVDKTTKEEATELLEALGMDISTAVNIFLKQVLLYDGIPFPIRNCLYNEEMIEAMKEAKQLSRDPNTKKYDSYEEARKDLGI